MANEELLGILMQGMGAWSEWREANVNTVIDLSGADLSRIEMSGMNLSKADLSGASMFQTSLVQANLIQANLSAARLNGANLSAARLRMANLNGADLGVADLTQASLRGTSLKGVMLIGTRLNQTDLCDANLSGATIGGAHLIDLDLSQVQGLDTIRHDGPSHISTDTLIKSSGKIPEVFLRGCGVPQSFIEYLSALIGAMEPIQFYSCFISYSTKDEEFAKRLHSSMRDKNLRVWFANEDLKGGYKLHEQIDEAIKVYDKFIIVLSPESLRSKWVRNEIRRTRKAELASDRRKFFPIGLIDYRELEDWECFDPDTGVDLAAELREYFVPDFRDWKNHDAFEKAFSQLLKGLKQVDEPPAPRAEPADMPQDPKKVLEIKKRRLGVREEQAALYGISTPPEILIEIEDLKREIARLEGRA